MDEQQLQQIAAQLRKPEGEDGIKTGEWMNKGNLHIHLDALKVLDAQPHEHLLEVGMGNGFFVKDILAKHPTITYTGCDFSEVMVAEATKLNAYWTGNGQATFIHTDGSTLPLPSQSSDKIFTINTIYFWENPQATLSEFKRVLKPHGQLIIALRPKHRMIDYPFTKYGFTLYDKESITALLTENGFTVTQILAHTEPDIELNGEMLKMENLIVSANHTKQ